MKNYFKQKSKRGIGRRRKEEQEQEQENEKEQQDRKADGNAQKERKVKNVTFKHDIVSKLAKGQNLISNRVEACEISKLWMLIPVKYGCDNLFNKTK